MSLTFFSLPLPLPLYGQFWKAGTCLDFSLYVPVSGSGPETKFMPGVAEVMD